MKQSLNIFTHTYSFQSVAEDFKAPEIIQLSSEQIANLPDAQFKTLVIKKLTELVEKMKAMLRETKENVQGTNSDCLLYTSDAADE